MEKILLIFVLVFPIILYFLGSRSKSFFYSKFVYFGSAIMIGLSLFVFWTQTPIELIVLQFIAAQADLPTITLGLRLDTLSGLIGSTVISIGAIVGRYSIRYLDDDPNRITFLRNLSLTVTFILLVILSNNFIQFILAWILTSFFLHQLLTHFNDREGAVQAASQKFWISRLGDGLLISASIILFSVFNSFDFQVIFSQLNNEALLASNSVVLNIACSLLILGAMTKSAQLPFHSWLPNTMESPTPVSALMHAGIINAGGYLVIRMGALLSSFPHTLDLLAIVGGLTTFYGVLVMLTQTDVKRSLAYSTISQMGFMMLQCGLGAFTIAAIHIVGHSFYKAHAFLSSASITDFGRLNRFFPKNKEQESLFKPFFTLIISYAIIFGVLWLLRVDIYQKPGALVLTLILGLAMGQTLLTSATKLLGVGYASMLCVMYFVVYIVFDKFLSSSITKVEQRFDIYDTTVFLVVGSLFLVVYLVQNNISRLRKSRLGQKLYVKFYSGFTN
jgi:NAD(P)H-quinone oxidoreductase subunit 5